jgi:hypothetical protein
VATFRTEESKDQISLANGGNLWIVEKSIKGPSEGGKAYAN